MSEEIELNFSYKEILDKAVIEIKQARIHISKQVNVASNSAYWNLGKLLYETKIEKGYGANVVNRLSVDLKSTFPEMGLSPLNLWDMKRFYERYKDANQKLRQCVAVLLWKHNLLILSKISNEKEALFYAEKAVELGWTRDVLLNYLKADAYQIEQSIPKSHNFDIALNETLAEQANDMLKVSYNLGFLGLTQVVKESELEKRLIEKIKQFVLELGKGFTFIGNQHRLEFNQKDYFVDILLYILKNKNIHLCKYDLHN